MRDVAYEHMLSFQEMQHGQLNAYSCCSILIYPLIGKLLFSTSIRLIGINKQFFLFSNIKFNFSQRFTYFLLITRRIEYWMLLKKIK